MDQKAKELGETLRAAILDLDAGGAERLAREIIDSGGDARETIDSVLTPTAANKTPKKLAPATGLQGISRSWELMAQLIPIALTAPTRPARAPSVPHSSSIMMATFFLLAPNVRKMAVSYRRWNRVIATEPVRINPPLNNAMAPTTETARETLSTISRRV